MSFISRGSISVTALLFTLSVQVEASPKLEKIDYNGSTEEVVITGQNFGAGPNVVMFENFEHANKFSEQFSSISNSWSDDVVLLEESSGNRAHRAKDPEIAANGLKGIAQIVVNFQKHYSEAFISFSVKTPAGTTFPAASEEKTFPSHSSWKFAWLMSGDDGFQTEGFDICLPTHVGDGSFTLGGNDGGLAWLDRGQKWWEWDKYNHMASYIKFSDQHSEAHDVDYSWRVVNNLVNMERAGTKEASRFSSRNHEFDRVNIPGWWGNGDNSNFDGLYDNIYIAVGENARSRAVITDNSDFEKSTFSITVMPKSWTDEEIKIDMSIVPSDKNYYLHIFGADGQRSSKGTRICPSCPTMAGQH